MLKSSVWKRAVLLVSLMALLAPTLPSAAAPSPALEKVIEAAKKEREMKMVIGGWGPQQLWDETPGVYWLASINGQDVSPGARVLADRDILAGLLQPRRRVWQRPDERVKIHDHRADLVAILRFGRQDPQNSTTINHRDLVTHGDQIIQLTGDQ